MGSSKFKEYKGLDLPAVNSEVLERWDAVDAFGKSISTREGHPTFVFYEGPPSANGMPGIHHVMARTIKDVVCRYKTQRGIAKPDGIRTDCPWNWASRRSSASRRRISGRKYRSRSTTASAAGR